MTGPYDDIINLPHHVSAARPQMSRENRAAQFSPFAALTGYDAAIRETARITDDRKELDDNTIEDLSFKLSMITDMIDDCPEIVVIYFQPDRKKEGGAYVNAVGKVKKIDEYERVIVMLNGVKIKIEDVLDINGEMFKDLI